MDRSVANTTTDVSSNWTGASGNEEWQFHRVIVKDLFHLVFFEMLQQQHKLPIQNPTAQIVANTMTDVSSVWTGASRGGMAVIETIGAKAWRTSHSPKRYNKRHTLPIQIPMDRSVANTTTDVSLVWTGASGNDVVHLCSSKCYNKWHTLPIQNPMAQIVANTMTDVSSVWTGASGGGNWQLSKLLGRMATKPWFSPDTPVSYTHLTLPTIYSV